MWRDVEGEVLYTFTIFDRLQAKQWLDPRLSTRSADIAADFAPFPSEQMQAHDVSPLSISRVLDLARWDVLNGLRRS
jgi:hypothetical protein